ncbi:hypothetical protein CVT26_008407 [Gymnopilus dilepis]|uniref:Uncharacterized protein n=1 Tax=Gymnopilus dilepis TaxID=231916 RepID=A0A409WNW1_9AGAR|nr:hypothetical protein CVT26_008407 [Gymnopilus dilepis]
MPIANIIQTKYLMVHTSSLDQYPETRRDRSIVAGQEDEKSTAAQHQERPDDSPASTPNGTSSLPLRSANSDHVEEADTSTDHRAALLVAEEELDKMLAAMRRKNEQSPDDEATAATYLQSSPNDPSLPPSYTFCQQPSGVPFGPSRVTTVRSGNVSNVTVSNSTVHLHVHCHHRRGSYSYRH